MIRDLKSGLLVRPTLVPAARTAAATGATVDRLGYNSAAFEVTVGAITTGGITFALQESDDDSTWSAIASTDLDGATPNLETGSPTFDSKAYTVGYRGAKRYIRCNSVHDGSPSGNAVYGVNVLLGHPSRAPVTQ